MYFHVKFYKIFSIMFFVILMSTSFSGGIRSPQGKTRPLKTATRNGSGPSQRVMPGGKTVSGDTCDYWLHWLFVNQPRAHTSETPLQRVCVIVVAFQTHAINKQNKIQTTQLQFFLLTHIPFRKVVPHRTLFTIGHAQHAHNIVFYYCRPIQLIQ